MKKIRALSVRQPFAEQIMRGTKKFEYRSQPTRILGTVYVYASLGSRPAADWRGLRIGPEDVPRGLIIGTVKIAGCRQLASGEFAWSLKSPKRLRKPVAPEANPQPVWFYPFGK
jgi:hypothetical protein